MACAPRNNKHVLIQVDCDSCSIEVIHTGYAGEQKLKEVFKETINGNKTIDINRYADMSCIKITSFYNFSNDTATINITEDGELIGVGIDTNGFCIE